MTVSMLAKIRRLHFRDASRFDTPEEVGGTTRLKKSAVRHA
jgi:hypothetical protein